MKLKTKFVAPTINSVKELEKHDIELTNAICRIVRSHAVNELYGAQVFDEPAIALAPNPYAKWLTCRVAMEEYGHHVRFRDLGKELNIPDEQLTPAGKKPLSIFEFPLKSWAEFCVIKLLADLAEIIQAEDLLHCSFIPLQKLAKMTMPEEQFHAKFGEDFTKELLKTKKGTNNIQDAIDRYYPMLPPFFGRSNSENNKIYRKWGIKQRTNDEMRDDYIKQVNSLVIDKLNLSLPSIV